MSDRPHRAFQMIPGDQAKFPLSPPVDPLAHLEMEFRCYIVESNNPSGYESRRFRLLSYSQASFLAWVRWDYQSHLRRGGVSRNRRGQGVGRSL